MYPKVVYSPGYDIRFLGLESLHPFDSCKYSRVWKEIEKRFGSSNLISWKIDPGKPISNLELEIVHDKNYLKSLDNPFYVAKALEIMALVLLPNIILQSAILEPMRLAVSGTIVAAREALKNDIAINLSGGYHHASKDQGEGFCIYSDIAAAIKILRKNGEIKNTDRIAIIDLDAHQGNGLERIFGDDEYIHFFDMYNQDIYPVDEWAKERINYNIPLHSGTGGIEYLKKLREGLPIFLKSIDAPKLAFYNAGTDVFKGDPLGKLNLSKKDILERDLFVAETLINDCIPLAMVLSGGYTTESYLIVSDSVIQILEKWGIKNIMHDHQGDKKEDTTNVSDYQSNKEDSKNEDSKNNDSKNNKVKGWTSFFNLFDTVLKVVDDFGKIKK